MKWWQKLFKRRKKEEEQDDWDEIVYARDSVDFSDSEQRSRYIENCLEQMEEASREMELLNGE